jgi:hypothetical protein
VDKIRRSIVSAVAEVLGSVKDAAGSALFRRAVVMS